MCLDVRKRCDCGKHHIQFHLRDNVLIPEAIAALYCPQCGNKGPFDAATMVRDNGWIIEYDMEIAAPLACRKLAVPMDKVDPAFLFDGGYGCWQEMYPGEQEDIKEEKEAILKLLEKDQKQYLVAMQRWNVERIQRLKEAGWRKAQQA